MEDTRKGIKPLLTLTGIEFSHKLFSISEAAKRLTICWSSLNNLIAEGRIGVVLIGKRRFIPGYELSRFLSENLIIAKESDDASIKSTNISSLFNTKSASKPAFDSMKLFEKYIQEGKNGKRIPKK